MSQDSNSPERRELLKAAFLRIEKLEARLAAAEEKRREPIAVIGLGCRFPAGANSPAEFWQLLLNGVDAIGDVPPDRWRLEDYYDADPDAPGKMYARGGGFVDRVDLFDPQFFGIAPREAAHIDPQQRLLLEVTWEALEHAGIAPLGLGGSATGIFIGLTTDDYSRLQARDGDSRFIDAYFGTGIAASVAAGRLSYVLGLRGPALTVDTACSSSLVAVHLACQSLRLGESRLALAGGVNLMLSPEGHIVASKGRMLAPDSRCKTFDARADGYVRSEGCGMVVLKRLADAVADGDPILAVIRGTAINQDGRSSGLTAPNGRAQEDVMRAALAESGFASRDVSYVETHGTGTSLGDPIEVQALGAVQGSDRPADAPLLIGSVKSNIGHLEAAAGVAGLIKTVLAIHHGEIPPNLHFEQPNPYIPWSELRLQVATGRTPWPDNRRIAGLSSFGFSGTNAHLVIDAAPERAVRRSAAERPVQLLPLSARSPEALRDLAARYALRLDACDAAEFPDVCFAAGAGRTHFEQRLAVTAATAGEAVERLRVFLSGDSTAGSEPSAAAAAGVARGEAALNRPPEVAFLFTGQGAQYVNMGRTLYETQPAFRAALVECDAIARPRIGRSLVEVLYPDTGGEADASALLGQTAWTQPALFAIEYALSAVWQSWGVRPAAVMGHSVGEFVAACVAGVLTLDDALTLVIERGRLMQALPAGGAMAAVAAGEEPVAAAIARAGDRVSIAGVNGPAQTVISGEAAAVEQVVSALAAEGIRAQRLAVSHAFHSAMVDPMLDAFERVAATVRAQMPQVPLVSNVTGRVHQDAASFDASYWRRHARSAVRFSDSIQTLHELGCRVFLEIGPSPTLITLGSRTLDDPHTTWLPSLRSGQDEWRQLLASLGALYVAGVAIDWAGFDRDYGRRKVQVPTYPFQRERHWVEMPVGRAATRSESPTEHPLLGRALSSPRLSDAVFERELDGDTLAAVRDHRIFGRVVMPAAAYLEMAAAAARTVADEPCVIEDFVIHEPLVFHAGPRVVQTSVTRRQPHEVEIHSRAAADRTAGWVLHARGRAVPARSAASPATQLSDKGASEGAGLASAGYYDRLAASGVAYGPAFQGIATARYAPGWAEGEIVSPPVVASELARYRVHPALLDACFQLLGLALPSGSDPSAGDVYLPVQVGRYHAERGAERHMRGSARVAPDSASGGETFVGDVELRTLEGDLIAAIHQLRFKKASHAALERAIGGGMDDAEWFHAVEWQPLEPARDPQPGAAAGSWIVFADADGCGAALAAGLERQGGRPILVFRGDEYSFENGVCRVRLSHPADLDALVTGLLAQGPIGGVVHLWNLDLDQDSRPTDAAVLDEARAVGTVSLLHVTQALARHNVSGALTVVTRGAQPADGAVRGVAGAEQAAAWGLGRVIAAEHADLRPVLVDLDPSAAPSDRAAALVREVLQTARDENQVALRAARRLGARLVRTRAAPESGRPGALEVPQAGSFTLDIRQRGVLENLELRPLDVPPPAPGEIRIRVQASGLNFRDVLSALGMYPGEPGPLGGEAVGVVEAVGSDVTRFAVGDPVLALTPRGFSSVVNTSEKLAWRRPEGMSVTQAATIPLVFQTAHYALNHLAGMKRGDRVLIHAGAGGVGLAAIQLAQIAGAEVFATAGSPEKRALLRSLGVPHVMDSRSLDFADEIRSATGGEGIDIVLNSLAGEFIPRSLALLRAGGRFLELGKTDLWDGARAAAVNPHASYAPVYLGDVCISDPDLVERMFGELMAWFGDGRLTPLPWRAFTIDRAVEAFRFMAQARHIGKIVIEQTSTSDRPLVRPDGTYLVTGAFGGLGLAIVRWLAASGARHLALVGRRPPTGEASLVVGELQSAGVEVHTVVADVADLPALRSAVDLIDAGAAPLRGIVHAAGVLDDRMLAQQDAARFERVMRPKVQGAWNLHVLAGDRDLDFMALFSAGAALFGSPGQGNYAAGNAFMDALASYRHGKGLRAVSINWGPWRDVGMAAALDSRDRVRWAAMGVHQIAPERGVAAFEQALRRDVAHVAVLPMDWPRFLSQWPAQPPALFRALAAASPASAPSAATAPGAAREFSDALASAPVEERHVLLEQHVREHVARVLGIAPGALRADRGFAELGMDSLMSVELSNRLRGTLGRQLPATLAFEQPTIAVLTAHLAALLGLEKPGVAAEADVDEAARVALLRHVEQLSDQEAEESLARELDSAGY